MTWGTGLLNSGTLMVFLMGMWPVESVRRVPLSNDRIAFSHASEVL